MGSEESSAADVAHLDLGASFSTRQHLGTLVAVAIEATLPNPSEKPRQLCVVGAGAQRTQDVPAERGEQAGVKFAVRRQARAMTVTTEWLGDGADEPDLAATIPVAVTRRDFAAVRRPD